jgi:hypothetical protein
MKVHLRLAGPLRLPPEGRELDWEGRKGTRVGTILARALGYSRKEMGFIQVLSGGKTMRLEEPLREDGELLVMLRLGGG